MRVRVRLFAALRERAGSDEVELDLPEGARVADALARLDDLAGGLSLVMAVNREYAGADHPLSPDDELALIPPVSGGAVQRAAAPAVHAALSDRPLSLDALVARVRDPRAGAVVTFAGVTREVDRLEYEAYAEMAREQLEHIATAAGQRHGLCAVAVEHRTGTVPLSEPSVLVAASAPHRAEAFAGAREVIDRVKELAPIWKREEGEWVRGRSPSRGSS